MKLLSRISNRLSKNDVLKVLELLKIIYPEAQCELSYNTPFQLLIATVLSAQTTDKKVNEVTSKLFQDYPTVHDFLALDQQQLENFIRKIGLYRNKAKNILALCRMLVEEYQAKVPNTFEELIKLPGVGRKTANVVLSNAFDVPAIAVDTHVYRVSNRIGLAKADDVVSTEHQLQKCIPKSFWSQAHHLLIWHGRRTCSARNPKCQICVVQELCLFYKEKKQKTQN